jgi:hypothetical protein
MNMSTFDPLNMPEYILFSISVPGLKMDSTPALLFARLLQETLERAIENAGLNITVCKIIGDEATQRVTQSLADLLMVTDKFLSGSGKTDGEKEAALGPIRLQHDDAARLLSPPAAWIVPSGERFWASLTVSDTLRGCAVIEAELKRLAFLERSKIGCYDPTIKGWRTHFPKLTPQCFDDHAFEILKMLGLVNNP